MEHVEQATAAPGEMRVIACEHDTLYRVGRQYRCIDCNVLLVTLITGDA